MVQRIFEISNIKNQKDQIQAVNIFIQYYFKAKQVNNQQLNFLRSIIKQSIKNQLALTFIINSKIVAVSCAFQLHNYIHFIKNIKNSKFSQILNKQELKIIKIIQKENIKNEKAVFGGYSAIKEQYQNKGYIQWFLIQRLKWYKQKSYNTYYSKVFSHNSLNLLLRLKGIEIGKGKFDEIILGQKQYYVVKLNLNVKFGSFEQLVVNRMAKL